MATSNGAADTSAFEETANRIRGLIEKLIQLATETGPSSRHGGASSSSTLRRRPSVYRRLGN